MKTFSYHLLIVCLLLAANGLQAQHISGQTDLLFTDCQDYKDSCIYVGNAFVKNIADKNFDELAYLLSDNCLFRALIPSSIVTSNDAVKTANVIKKWFNLGESEQYKVVDSQVDFLVDCLHMNYKIDLSYMGTPYQVEQQLYCEVASGEIQKLSLICSGFRKVKEKR